MCRAENGPRRLLDMQSPGSGSPTPSMYPTLGNFRNDSPGYVFRGYDDRFRPSDMCYLCGESIDGPTDPDHIIPKVAFDKGSSYRPTLQVHSGCNRAKSRDDEWFKRMVDLMCAASNPDADKAAGDFFRKAEVESRDAYIVGASTKLRHYKLARNMISSASSRRLQITHQGQRVPQLEVGPENMERLMTYVGKMCEGLYLKNVPGSCPVLSGVEWIQYVQTALTGDRRDLFRAVIRLMAENDENPSFFWQRWGKRIQYFGCPVSGLNTGFVYIEFYSSAGFLALFSNG